MTIRDIFSPTDEPTPEQPDPNAAADPLEGVVAEGKIIKVLEEKGFGFIVSPVLRYTRIFFHWSALNQNTLNFAELKKGMRVRFTLKKFPQSWRAIKIEVLKDE